MVPAWAGSALPAHRMSEVRMLRRMMLFLCRVVGTGSRRRCEQAVESGRPGPGDAAVHHVLRGEPIGGITIVNAAVCGRGMGGRKGLVSLDLGDLHRPGIVMRHQGA